VVVVKVYQKTWWHSLHCFLYPVHNPYSRVNPW